MRINSEIIGDLEVRGVKLYGESRTRVMNVLFKIEVEKDQAAKELGADFHHCAFSGMRLVDGVARHAAGVISKPNLVCEVHSVEIAGHKHRVSPEIPKITTVEGSPAVIVEMVLPILVDKRQDAYGAIVLLSGETVRIKFKSIQVPLPLSPRTEESPENVAEILTNAGAKFLPVDPPF